MSPSNHLPHHQTAFLARLCRNCGHLWAQSFGRPQSLGGVHCPRCDQAAFAELIVDKELIDRLLSKRD